MNGESPSEDRKKFIARVLELLLPLVVAGLVSYATAVFALQREVDVLKATQNLQYLQLKESIDLLRQDVRSLFQRESGR